MNSRASSPIHTRTLPFSGTRPDEAESKCAPTPTRPRTQERSAPLAPRAVASQIDPGHSLRPKRSSFDHPEAISPRCTDLAPGVLDNGLVKVTSHLVAPSRPRPGARIHRGMIPHIEVGGQSRKPTDRSTDGNQPSSIQSNDPRHRRVEEGPAPGPAPRPPADASIAGDLSTRTAEPQRVV